MDEFRVPLPIIELKEEATEIVDLESSAKIPEEVALDWDHKVRLELNKNVPPIDSNSFFNCMEWYKRELKEITGSFADNDILKKCMMRHLKFFETIMRKCFHLDVNRYLDNAEDLLTSYANLIINDLMEKKNSLNRHELKKISAAESRRLKSLLLRCLLEKQDRVAHVLMRIDSYPNIRPCRDVLNNLFTHFITYLHHTPTDLNYIRCFIICQKWMQNRRPQEWELLERYVRDIFKKKPDSISKNQLLRNILIEVRPMMSGRLEMANYLYDKVKFMSNEYFNIVKNQERVEVMEIEDDTAECFPVWGERGDSDFDEEDYRKWMKELENSVKTFVNEVTIPDIKIESPEDCVILEAPKKFPAPIINRPPLQSNLIVGTKIEIPDEPIPQPPTVLEIKKPPDDLSEIAEKLPEVIPEEPPTICEENVLPETVEKENNVIEPPSVGERLQSNLIVGTKIEIPDEPIPQPPTVLEIKKPPDAGNTIDLSEIAEKLPEVIPEEPPTICEQPMVENVLPETVEKENNVIEPPSAGERQTTEEIVAPIREETIEKVPETTESLNVEEKTTEENTVTKEVTTVEVTVEKTVEEQSTSKTTRNRKFYDDSFERFLYGTIKTSETEKVATVETLSESWLMEQQITSTSVESEKATEKHDETTTEETVKKPDDSVFMTPPPSERFAENSEQTEKQENKTKTPTINNFDSFEREVDGLLSGPMTRSQTDVVNPDDNFDLFGDNDEERRHCESDSDIESPSYEPITELIEPRKIEPLIVKIPKNGRKPVIKRKKDKTRNKRGRKKENKDRKSEPEQPIIEEPVKRLRGRSKSAVIDEPPIVEEETSPISNGLPVTADAPMPHKGILKDPEKPKKKKQPLQFAPDVKSAEEENKVKARQRPLNSRRPEKQMICVNYDERLLQSETRWKPLPGEIAPAPVPSPPKGMSDLDDPSLCPPTTPDENDVNLAPSVDSVLNLTVDNSYSPTFVENDPENALPIDDVLAKGLNLVDCKYDSCKSLLENFDEFRAEPAAIPELPEKREEPSEATRLPLKKRKNFPKNCENDEDDTEEEYIEIIKQATLPKKEISYPAKTMISIAEVQEQEKNPRPFKTAAERKEIPPVDFNATTGQPRIITEQYNNHTYNNPTINYHMNSPFPQPLAFNCAYVPNVYFSLLPVNSTTTFTTNNDGTTADKSRRKTTVVDESAPPAKKKRGRPKKNGNNT